MAKAEAVHSFESVSEWLAYIESPIPSALSRLSTETRDADWFGTPNLDAAISLARLGWPEGRVKAEALSATLLSRLNGSLPLPEIRFDVTGDVLDIGRYVAGDPEDYMYFAPSEDMTRAPIAKIVRFVINVAASGSTSTEAMIMRGVAAVAAITCLESMGLRCEVDLAHGTGRAGYHVEEIIRIKDAGEALDLDRLTFLCAHPATLRRLIFATEEHFSDDVRTRYSFTRDGTYSAPQDLDDQGDIYLGRLVGEWTQREAYQWVVGVLQSQGIQITEGN